MSLAYNFVKDIEIILKYLSILFVSGKVYLTQNFPF